MDALHRVNPGITFCLNSAQGADRSGKSSFLFAEAKGRAENILFDSSLNACYAFRPGFINPGRRKASSRIPAWLARPFYTLIPALGIDVADLARVMLHVGLTGSQRNVFESRDLRRISRELAAAEATGE